MATRIRIKRGTESQITGYTGPHLEGELAYATNTGNVFVNDGTAFISIGGGGGEIPTLQTVTDAGAITTNDITTGSVTSNGNFLITGNDSTVQLRGSSVDFNIQTAAADNVARIATTTGGSARLDLYNHISGFNGALEFRATSWENDALVISGGLPNAVKFLVSRDPNAATLQVTGDSYFTGNFGIGTTAPAAKLHITGTSESSTSTALRVENSGNDASFIALDNGTVYSTGPGYDDRNVAFGLESQQYSDTVTVRNVSIGRSAAQNNTKGGTVAVGYQALKSNTGTGAVAIGRDAGQNNTGGYAALIGAFTGQNNTAGQALGLGIYALQENTGQNAIGIGNGALRYNTGADSLAVGVGAGENNSETGIIAIGPNALNTNTGGYSIGIGYQSLFVNSGTQNIGIGKFSLYKAVGLFNTAIGGNSALKDVALSGRDNTFLGANTTFDETNPGINNATGVGANITLTNSNTVILGNGANVGIGTAAPTSKLHVNGTALEQFRIETPGGPSGSGDTKGNVGDIAYDADFFYIKTDNGWGRVPLDFGF
jgi:hypothetical protein